MSSHKTFTIEAYDESYVRVMKSTGLSIMGIRVMAEQLIYQKLHSGEYSHIYINWEGDKNEVIPGGELPRDEEPGEGARV